MSIAVGQPCPTCRTPMKALGTSTYCPDEDLHGLDFQIEADTEPLIPCCTKCKSTDLVNIAYGYKRCVDCNHVNAP